MSLLVPVLVLVGAIVTSYLFCVRPMRRGTCAMSALARAGRSSSGQVGPVSSVSSVSDAELAQVRQELALLREQAGSTARTER